MDRRNYAIDMPTCAMRCIRTSKIDSWKWMTRRRLPLLLIETPLEGVKPREVIGLRHFPHRKVTTKMTTKEPQIWLFVVGTNANPPIGRKSSAQDGGEV